MIKPLLLFTTVEDSSREIDRRLVQAYIQTRYTVPGLGFECRVGEVLSAGMSDRLPGEGAAGFAFLTAWNPRSVQLPEAENRRRNAALADRLRALGLVFYPALHLADAGDWPPEESFFVVGIPEGTARALAEEFEQYAWVSSLRSELRTFAPFQTQPTVMDISRIPSPCFVLDENRLRRNLTLIDRVQREAGVTIILAFKGFAMWSAFPIVREYLSGATASSLNEARLCFEEMGVRAHTYAVAYVPREFGRILKYSSHITFNSISQYKRYRRRVQAYAEPVSMGIRVNPGWSPVGTALYNPAAPGSRLGEPAENFKGVLPEGVEGLHFHTLCESTSFDLEKTLEYFEGQFGAFLPHLKWVNFGGGHLMTRAGYDVEHLIGLLQGFRQRYPHLQVILEPGSAIAWDTGVLVASVLDVVRNGGVRTAILDVSFTAHMPDTLEMPYRPRVRGADTDPVAGKPQYRLGGVSCLSGDFMTEYSFDEKLKIGQKIVFEDMIHYTMVKTTTFNGVTHPGIAIWRADGKLDMVRKFGYNDYKRRLS